MHILTLKLPRWSMATIVDGDELTDKKSDERRRKGMAKLAQL
jgi:hypothetical protein